MEVIVQAWTESERGWGQRPDGLSIHFTSAQCAEFVLEQEAVPPGQIGAPDSYSYADGSCYTAVIVKEEADEDILALALKGKTFCTHLNNPKWLRKI